MNNENWYFVYEVIFVNINDNLLLIIQIFCTDFLNQSFFTFNTLQRNSLIYRIFIYIFLYIYNIYILQIHSIYM